MRSLDLVDRILTESDAEFEFVKCRLEQAAQSGGAGVVQLSEKQIRHGAEHAAQTLRSNYLRLELNTSFRQTAFLIAAGEDFQRFIFAGDFVSAKCPGKSKLNDFAQLVPDDFIRWLNAQLRLEFSTASSSKHGLAEPLVSKTLWLDATCLIWPCRTAGKQNIVAGRHLPASSAGQANSGGQATSPSGIKRRQMQLENKNRRQARLVSTRQNQAFFSPQNALPLR